jgi:hypothetical protein
MRSPALVRHISALTPAGFKMITLDRPGPHNKPKVHEDKAVKLTSYPGTVRQLVVTGLGRDAATVIITNEHQATIRNLISQYARRMTIEQRLAEIIRSFCADALSSTVNLNVDLDIMLCVLAKALLAAFRTRLGAGYHAATPDTSNGASSTTPEPSPPPAARSPSASTGAPTHPSCARPAFRPTPPSPGGTGGPFTSSSANPRVEEAAWKSALRAGMPLTWTRTLQIVLVHLIQIVGEAANGVSDSLIAAHPEVPWRRLSVPREPCAWSAADSLCS